MLTKTTNCIDNAKCAMNEENEKTILPIIKAKIKGRPAPVK